MHLRRSLIWVLLVTVCLLLVIGAFLYDRLFIDIWQGQGLSLRVGNSCYTASVGDGALSGLSNGNGSRGLAELLQKIRLCTQEERAAHVKKLCEQSNDAAKTSLLRPAPRSFVDHKHRFTYCWMSKAACTSLKAFILEANGLDLSKYQGKGNSLDLVHFAETVNKYGLQQMHQLNETEAKSVVDRYFNVMAIRHPFDRLVAYYRDKIVDTDRSSNHPERAADILREFRPQLFANNKTLSEMTWPQQAIGVPTFRELMTWIYKHKVMDEHWNFIYETCHPCAHDWGAILRVETMDSDGKLLAKLVNSTHYRVPVRHSHESNASYLQFGKTLQQFGDLPEQVIDYFLEFYRTDMKMFGYRWEKTTNTAYCAIETPNGLCC